MADEEARSDSDVAFVREFADRLAEALAGRGLLAPPDRPPEGHDPAGLIRFLEAIVARHVESRADFLSAEHRYWLERELESTSRIFDASPPEAIPMLTGLDNAYGADPIVDIFNEEALATIEEQGGGTPSERTTPPRYSLGWLRDQIGIGAPVRLANRYDASRSYFMLFIDTLRALGKSQALAASTPTMISYTVNSKLQQYVLSSYPQYKYSPSRFGSVLTSPVTDSLTSGYYYFEGKSGRSIKKDKTPHYVGGSRTATVLSW